MDQAVEAARRVGTLSRRACRERFEARFTAPRMAGDYLRVYGRLIDKAPSSRATQELTDAG